MRQKNLPSVICFLICAIPCLMGFGCAQSKKKVKPYILTISVMEFTSSGKPFFLNRVRETILAENDTIAYGQAAYIFYTTRKREQKIKKSSADRSIRFEIKDGNGKFINSRLSRKCIDSILFKYNGSYTDNITQ